MKKNKKIIPVVGVIAFNNNRVVLVKHTELAQHLTGMYGFPAGRIEEGESDIVAAAREFREETGLETTEDDLVEYPHNISVASIPRKNGKTETFRMHVFLCKRFTGELTPSEETIPQWIDIEALDDYPLIINVKQIVLAARKNYVH